MDPRLIRLTAPCSLRHRALAVRLVAESCRLVRGEHGGVEHSVGFDVRDPFDVAVVSAFAHTTRSPPVTFSLPASVPTRVVPL